MLFKYKYKYGILSFPVDPRKIDATENTLQYIMCAPTINILNDNQYSQYLYLVE